MKVRIQYVPLAELESFLQKYADLGVPAEVLGVDSYKPVYETVSERGGSSIRRLEAQTYAVLLREVD